MIRFHQKSSARALFILLTALVLVGCGRSDPTVEETLAKAEGFLAGGAFVEAIKQLEAFDEHTPDDPRILETLAEAYAAEGDFALAAFQYLRLAEIEAYDPMPLLFAAGALREAGDPDGAARVYERYLSEEPGDATIWKTLAQLHLERGNRQAAIDAHLQSNQHNPSGSIQVAIARLFLAGNNLAQAQSWFASALELDDEARPEALLGLIETALSANRPSDAEGVLEQLDAEFPGRFDRSPLASQRPALNEWRRRQDEARRAAEELARITQRRAAEEQAAAPDRAPDPEDPSDRNARPSEPVSDKDLRVAGEDHGRPAETSPEPAISPSRTAPSPLVERAKSLLSAGEPEQAVSLYREALLDDRDNPEIWMALSEAQFQAGQHDWALASASEAMRRDPEEPRYTMQYLRAAQQALPPYRLIRETERARRQFPHSPEILLTLARAYEEVANDRRAARNAYRQFLELAPDGHPQRPYAEDAMSRL